MQTRSIFSQARSVFGWVAILLALARCESETENAAEEPETELSAENTTATGLKKFHEAVGAPVDAAVAKRWIENNRNAGREVEPRIIQATALRRILDSPQCVGVSLQYGIDDLGQLRIFPAGVGADGRATDPKTPAQVARFLSRYTGTVKGHFFGRDTFTRLLDQQGSEAVRATPALDEHDAPQLLLSNAADVDPHVYEDVSNPCTTACPSRPEF